MKYTFLAFICLITCAFSATSLQDRRIANILAVYDHLLYPNSYPLIASNGTLATFFHPNVTGRINTIGMFTGRQETVEYFYALGNPVSPTINPGQLRVIQYDVRVLDILGTRASIQVNIHFSVYPTNETHHNLTQTGWFGFYPDCDLVAWYDLTILRLGQVGDLPSSTYNTSIAALCASQDSNCQGANQQFATIPDCVNFMSNISFGSWYNAFSDTVICRILHNYLTRVRPDFHCPHVGPTGGLRCIEHPYEEWYTFEFIVNLGTDTVPAPNYPNSHPHPPFTPPHTPHH